MDPLSIIGNMLSTIGVRLLARLTEASALSELLNPAIESTQADMGPDLVVDEALRAWCTGEEFRAILQRFVSGERDLIDQLVDSFLGGDFYLPEEADRRAVGTEIIASFLGHLQSGLFESSDGHLLLANRMQAIHDEDRAQGLSVGQTLTELVSSVARIEERLPHDGRDAALNARIDAARQLLDEGKPVSARSLLEQIEQRLPADASSDIRYRLETNLGSAANELGDMQAARRHLNAALLLRPHDTKALANASQSAVAAGDARRGLELAERAWEAEQNPHSGLAMIVGLHASEPTRLGLFLSGSSWLSEDPQILRVLGHWRIEDGETKEGIEFYRKSLTLQPGDPQMLAELAVAIVNATQRALAAAPPLPWRMGEAQSALAEAESLLAEAAHGVEAKEPRARHLELVVLRGAVLWMLGRYDDALSECDYVLHQDAENAEASKTKGLALLLRDPAAAAPLLERARSREPDDLVVGLSLAEAYRASANLPKSLEVLDSVLHEQKSDTAQREALTMKAEVLAAQGSTEASTAIETTLLGRWPAQGETMLASARIRQAVGDDDGAIERLREALAIATGPLRGRVSLELGDALARRRDFLGAAIAFEDIADDRAPLPIRQRYAAYLFNAGRLKDALSFTQRQRLEGPPVPLISEVEAEVLAHIGDLAKARDLFARLAEIDRRRPALWLRAAYEAFRQSDSDGARGYLEKVTAESIRDDPVALMQLGQLRRLLGEPDSLPPAYRARRIQFDDANLHLAYVSLFLGRNPRDEGSLDISEVGVDAAVELQDGSRTDLVIVEGDDPDGRSELRPDHPLVQRLWGHRQGDSVEMPNGATVTISSIKSKYVHAFQETPARFSTLFGEDERLKTIHIGDGDYSQLLVRLDQRAALATGLIDLYQAQRLPLAVTCRMLAASIYEVTRELRESPTSNVLVSPVTAEDRMRERANAEADEAVLDPTALVTIDSLDLWDTAKTLYRSVLIPQPALEELRGLVTSGFVAQRWGFIGKVGGRYFSQEGPEQEAKDRLDWLQRLADMARSKFEVVPVLGLLDIAPDQLGHMNEMLGADSYAALQVARVERAVLWADDLAIRRLARSGMGIEGCSTPSVLARARDRGLLTNDEFRSAIRKMAEARFLFLDVEPEVLVRALVGEGAGVTPAAARMAGLLLGTDYDTGSAMALATEVIRGIWLQSLLLPRKLLLLDLVLTSLVRERNGRVVLERLVASLEPRIRLLADRDLILQSIGLWAQKRDRV